MSTIQVLIQADNVSVMSIYFLVLDTRHVFGRKADF